MYILHLGKKLPSPLDDFNWIALNVPVFLCHDFSIVKTFGNSDTRGFAVVKIRAGEPGCHSYMTKYYYYDKKNENNILWLSFLGHLGPGSNLL